MLLYLHSLILFAYIWLKAFKKEKLVFFAGQKISKLGEYSGSSIFKLKLTIQWKRDEHLYPDLDRWYNAREI